MRIAEQDGDGRRRSILPSEGLIPVSTLAEYLDINPYVCRRNLLKRGVKITKLGYHLDQQMVRLEDLK